MRSSLVAATAALAMGVYADPYQYYAPTSKIGRAYIINSCSDTVNLNVCPSANGGYQESFRTLAPGEVWSQEYTQLTNNNGWSLKVYPMGSTPQQASQWEYTFHNDSAIWIDLSHVDAEAYKSWVIWSPTEGCSLQQRAYRHSTDDAWGMQSCSQAADVVYRICSESIDNSLLTGGSGSGAGSSAAAAPAQSSPPAAAAQPASSSSPAAAAYSAPAQSSSAAPATTQAPAQPVDSPTTMVTEVVTVVKTAVMTVTVGADDLQKRHAHHRRALH